MTHDVFERILVQYGPIIAAIARKLAGRDEYLVEELVQEGRISLWGLKLSRVRKNKDSYVRNAIRFRMVDHLRRYRSSRMDSLEFHAEMGRQIEKDSRTGIVRFVDLRSEEGEHSYE